MDTIDEDIECDDNIILLSEKDNFTDLSLCSNFYFMASSAANLKQEISELEYKYKNSQKQKRKFEMGEIKMSPIIKNHKLYKARKRRKKKIKVRKKLG